MTFRAVCAASSACWADSRVLAWVKATTLYPLAASFKWSMRSARCRGAVSYCTVVWPSARSCQAAPIQGRKNRRSPAEQPGGGEENEGTSWAASFQRNGHGGSLPQGALEGDAALVQHGDLFAQSQAQPRAALGPGPDLSTR